MFYPQFALIALFLSQQFFFAITHAYKPLSDSFLRNISSSVTAADFDPQTGILLSPLLVPRALKSPGHRAAQDHFINFFSNTLPKWDFAWHNSTTSSSISISNLVFQREPPWTKPGQANWLTLAAHYDSGNEIEGYVGAVDNAVSCALLMHVATAMDGFMTQMHDEMAALGEGGTVEMDMGIQIIFLDGKEAESSTSANEPPLYGSRALSEAWEKTTNPVGSKYPNALSQISMFVLLDMLGSTNPAIPSYLRTTHWTYRNIAQLESRLRKLTALETQPPSAFFPDGDSEKVANAEEIDDHIPFMERGVPFLNFLPKPLPIVRHTSEDVGKNLDMLAVRDWAKIVTGFALEWLDMMEVWPDETR